MAENEGDAAERVELSVVLATKDGAATIGWQLEALARQEWQGAWELIVSDNGSTDATPEIVEAYRPRIPNLRTIASAAVAGPAHACNAGAREARGTMLAFCNDDDEVAERWVEAMAEAIARHGFVAGRLEHERLNEPWTIAVRGRPLAEELMSWPFADYFPYGFACTLGVRRELHERIGGFDETLITGEDVDYCWRLQQLGVELHFAPEAVTHYRFRSSLRSTFTQAVGYGGADTRLYRKHRSRGLHVFEQPWRLGLRNWARVVRRFATARSRSGVGLALWELGLRLGAARASLRERVVFF